MVNVSLGGYLSLSRILGRIKQGLHWEQVAYLARAREIFVYADITLGGTMVTDGVWAGSLGRGLLPPMANESGAVCMMRDAEPAGKEV